MRSRFVKFPRARIVAIAVGVGVIGSLVTAPASFAAPPASGVNCQASDGKISGRGSTFQNNALNNALISGFRNDVCGPVGTAGNLTSGYGGTDPAGTNMIAYNYSEAGNPVKNGSGAGINAMICRTDPFAGTDLPYNGTQIDNMNNTPGTGGTCDPVATALGTGLTGAPYPPAPNGAAPAYPHTGDTTPGSGPGIDDGMMNFPIGGGAVAIAVNLNGVCTTPPAGLNLTNSEFEKIMQGTITQWNDTALTTTNPSLTTGGCHGTIQRIVRFDNSGTTAITKNNLNGINSATLCDGSTRVVGSSFGGWSTLGNASPNTTWPTGPNCKDANNNLAAPVYTSGTNGSGDLINLVDSTTGGGAGNVNRPFIAGTTTTTCPGGVALQCGGEGGIGYAELGLWPNPLPAGVTFVKLQNQASNGGTPVFVAPGSPGAKSNCNVAAKGLPGDGSAPFDVGLGGPDANWANDSGADTNNQTLQKENITFVGSGYSNCGLTFDMVYTGMSNESGGGPVEGLTNDQRRTLYSFFTYVFSPLGQSHLDSQTYDELPALWLPQLLSGFQSNY